MAPSYRKIDYSLRPAKHAERRMLVEAFGRLSAFAPIDEYTYAGMGSIWFSDFILAHRHLGIRNMISMEWPRGSNDRVQDNVPLASITLVPLSTSQALPKLDWKQRSIVWLDYDGLISRDVLTDIGTVASRTRSGSLLAVTVQCNEASEMEKARNRAGADAVSLFLDTFNRDRVGDIEEDDLYGWRFAELCRKLIAQEIQAALALRNIDLSPEEKLIYQTICSFEYSDGAMMTTLLVVFYSASEQHLLEKCTFERLDFIKSYGPAIRVELPNLTLHEMRWLRRQLPVDNIATLDIKYLPITDAQRFARLYRYMPNFAVLEV